MQRRALDSSVLSSVGYDVERQLLEVELRSRRVYVYREVPELVFHRLLRAASPGALFNTEIRDRYDCERVD
jgi:hypothetical protein